MWPKSNFFFLLGLIFWIVVLCVFAQAIESRATSNFFIPDYKIPQLIEQDQQVGGAIIGFIFKLLIILVAIYILIWLIRLIMNRRYKTPLHSALIQSVDNHYISPKQSLHLFNIGQSVFLIGATEQKISLLHEFKNQEELTQKPEAKTTSATFSEQLKSFLRKNPQKFKASTVEAFEQEIADNDLKDSF